jgi:tryptophan-rich sensory protein
MTEEQKAATIGALALFALLVLGGGLLIGFATVPGDWYAALVKPSFNPPNWVFAPVWSLLYVLIAIAGWRTWSRGRNSVPMRIWWLQLGLNFLWSPMFFLLHAMGPALFVVVLLFSAIAGFMVAVWPRDRVASLLFAPYAAWVGFASILNASLLLLNPQAT